MSQSNQSEELRWSRWQTWDFNSCLCVCPSTRHCFKKGKPVSGENRVMSDHGMFRGQWRVWWGAGDYCKVKLLGPGRLESEWSWETNNSNKCSWDERRQCFRLGQHSETVRRLLYSDRSVEQITCEHKNYPVQRIGSIQFIADIMIFKKLYKHQSPQYCDSGPS